MIASIISEKEIEYVIKIVKFLKKPDLLIKDVSKKITNEAKQEKDGFPGILLDTLSVPLSANMLGGKAKIPG